VSGQVGYGAVVTSLVPGGGVPPCEGVELLLLHARMTVHATAATIVRVKKGFRFFMTDLSLRGVPLSAAHARRTVSRCSLTGLRSVEQSIFVARAAAF
jgi:hypothetical protein